MILSQMLNRCASFVLVAVVAGCSTIYSFDTGGDANDAAQAALPGSGPGLGQILSRRDAEPAPRLEQVFTAELLATVETPLLVVTFLDSGDDPNNRPWVTFVPSAQNKDVTTWVDGTARTISLTKTGFVRATRGYGRDLMSIHTRDLEDAFRVGQSDIDAERIHWLLDGENQSLGLVQICEVRESQNQRIEFASEQFETVYFEENCTDDRGEKQLNRYWFDAKLGTMRRSIQWISPEIGRLQFQRLN